ncbi:MAG: tetratricopeptide repeat protein [Saccharothrix sp.]|nr:tetratricopeptide repeat protein [Saccharothrix sp.]
MADGVVRNELGGTVLGAVVQAGRIDRLVTHTPAAEVGVVPRQLPAAVPDFCGREVQVAALDALIVEVTTNGRGGAAVIAALDGTGGVGKTTLAVWWAHRVQDRFPDGTLFVNLRGYGPSDPLAPHVVLSGFLTSLGVAEGRIPGDVDAQSALFRSLVAARRMLVVLDNAATAEQVRPLLPGSAGSVTLVTSRGALSELVTTGAARRITLDVFDTGDAVRMVEEVVGRNRVTGEPEPVRELAVVCAGLPLALRVAATRVASRPFLSVADVVEEIRQEQRGLVGMSGSWQGLDGVRSVFDWSYTRLGNQQARVFRLLGLHPVPEFGVHAVAALTGLEVRAAERVLEELAEHHLVEPVARRRYRTHDLLHDYAAYRADLDETSAARGEALTRLLAWCAWVADTADRLVFPDKVPMGIELNPVMPAPPVADRTQALVWLAAEQSTLSALQQVAAELGLHRLVISLAGSARHLLLGPRSLWPERVAAETRGLASARATGDRASEMLLLVHRGHIYRRSGDFAASDEDFNRVLELADPTSDLERRMEAMDGLGANLRDQGRYADAWECYQVAMELARESGSEAAEAIAMCTLSQTSVGLGLFEQALDYAEQELVLRRRVGVPIGVAYAMHDVAVARQGLGEHDTAIALCEQTIATYIEYGGAEAERAEALETLATSLVSTGRIERAVERLREAAVILTDRDDPRAEHVRQRADALASSGDR